MSVAFRITLDGLSPIERSENLPNWGWPENVYVLSKSLSINQGESGTRAVLNFTLKDESNNFYLESLVGRLINVWEYTGTGNDINSWKLIWGGQLDEPNTRKINEKLLMGIGIVGIDHHSICDRIAINQGYAKTKINVLVKEIIDKYLKADGIWYDSTSIQSTTKEVSVNCPYIYASKVFTELSDFLGWQWYIEPNKKFHFHEYTFEKGPYTHEYIGTLSEDLARINDRSEYRNIEVLRNVKDVTDELIETSNPFPNGETRNFFLNYPICDDLGEPQVYVCTWIQRNDPPSDTRQTIGISGLETTPQWFYTDGNNQIYQNSDYPAIEAGYYIVLKYRGSYEIDIIKSNDTAIAARAAAENGSGIYYDITENSNVVGIVLGNEKAQALLNKYCRIAQKFKISSYNHRWEIGQLCRLVLPTFQIDSDYLVMELSIKDRGNRLKRTVTLIDGLPIGGWIRFFKKWLTANDYFTIREDAIVSIPFIESEEFNIAGVVTIDSIDCLYPETDPGGLHPNVAPGGPVPGTINNTEIYYESDSD